jgi:hypothetical protein
MDTHELNSKREKVVRYDEPSRCFTQYPSVVGIDVERPEWKSKEQKRVKKVNTDTTIQIEISQWPMASSPCSK